MTTYGLLDETTLKLLDPDELIKSEANAMESLDYDRIDSMANIAQKKNLKPIHHSLIHFQQWVITFLIGFLVAMFGVFMDVLTKLIVNAKNDFASRFLRDCSGCFGFPFLVVMAFNVGLAGLASCLCVYWAPAGAGSGIPEVKCYLNGIKVPEILRLKTLFVKTIGTICTVAGGLACGNEGPMIHIGAMLAAGVSQGKSSTIKLFASPVFDAFRNDHDKRDFVSGGAAAGIAGAFGAPVGGTLFSLEEGSSFWNQGLTWRTFFCAIVASFTLNLFLSGIEAHYWSPGGIEFSFQIIDEPDRQTYYLVHLLFFVGLGIVGGVTGAIFNMINHKIMLFRRKFIAPRPIVRLLEVIIIAAITTTVTFFLTVKVNRCVDVPMVRDGLSSYNWSCGFNQTNDMALLWMGTGEMAVKNLFSSDPNMFSDTTLAIYTVVYFVLAMFTLGIAAPSGLLVPCLAIGGGYGRLLGQLLMKWTAFHKAYPVNLPTFAVIGAASFLGGTARMTIALCVILIETTGSVSRGLPLMVTLMVAKWVGDSFGHGIYDIHIGLKRIPLLEWDPDHEMTEVRAEDIMTDHIVSFYQVDRVGKIHIVLQKTTHGGFPIISKSGILQGLILRSQLITLLKEKVFQDNPDPNYCPELDLSLFGKDYPRYPSVSSIKIAASDRNKYINITPYMNLTPYLIQKNATVDRVFRLFRTMGLRHLPVIDEYGKVVGMITRRDLVNFEDRVKEKRAKARLRSSATNENIPLISQPRDFDSLVDEVMPDFSSFPKTASLSTLKRPDEIHIHNEQEAINTDELEPAGRPDYLSVQ